MGQVSHFKRLPESLPQDDCCGIVRKAAAVIFLSLILYTIIGIILRELHNLVFIADNFDIIVSMLVSPFILVLAMKRWRTRLKTGESLWILRIHPFLFSFIFLLTLLTIIVYAFVTSGDFSRTPMWPFHVNRVLTVAVFAWWLDEWALKPRTMIASVLTYWLYFFIGNYLGTIIMSLRNRPDKLGHFMLHGLPIYPQDMRSVFDRIILDRIGYLFLGIFCYFMIALALRFARHAVAERTMEI